MTKVENTTIIQKLVEEVFAYANEPETQSKWQSGVESVKYSEGDLGVGTQFVVVRKFMGRELESAIEITAFEPNERYAAKSLKGPVDFDVDVTYESVGEGTKMITVIEAEPGGFFKLAGGLDAKQLEKSVQEDSEKLKTLLESS